MSNGCAYKLDESGTGIFSSNWTAGNPSFPISETETVFRNLPDVYTIIRLLGVSPLIDAYTNESAKITLISLAPTSYKTKKPIPITVIAENEDEYIAAFEEAEIYFSGSTPFEAIQELKIEIAEAYELYKAEPHLGARPKKQLAVLEDYIGKEKSANQ